MVDPYTFKSLPYDPIKDFTVISRIAEVTFVILAHPDVPAKNLPELFAYAKANPDKLAVATDGARRFSGMVAAWLNKLAGTNISYVPYTQMTQGIQDALAGRVQLVIIAIPAAKGHIAAGKLRPLAVTSLKRLPEFPDVQAVAETFPGFDFAGWFALAAPTGVPPAIIERVHKEVNAILQDPAVSDKLKTMGFVPYGGGTLKDTQRLHPGAAQGLGHADQGDRAAAGVTSGPTTMNERFGVGVAVASSAVGGAAAVATRYLIESAEPITLNLLTRLIAVCAGLWIATTEGAAKT